MNNTAARSGRTLTKEFMRLINRRAYALSQIAAKDYQRRMVEDFIAQDVHGNPGNPEDWWPQELCKKD